MNAFRRVMKNTGILYVRMGITVFFSLYATRITLNALGVSDFGIFNVVGSAIAMLTFLNSSMAAATQRYMSFANGRDDKDELVRVFNASIFIHAGVALLVCGLLQIFGHFLFGGVLKIDFDRMEAARTIYIAATLSVLFSVISVPYDAVINARENMLVFAVLSVMEAVFKLAIAIYISDMSGDRLMAFGWLMAAVAAVTFACKSIYCHWSYSECKISFSKYLDKYLLKKMSAFAGWSFFGASTSLISNYGQGIVINSYFGSSVNAAQGIAAQVSGQLGAFAGTMLKALNPMIAKSEGAGDRGLMIKATLFGSKLSFFLLMIFYVPIIIEMPYVFGLWLKAPPEYSVVFCRLLLIRNLIEQLFVTLTASIAAVGDIKKYQIASSLLTLVPLPVSYAVFIFGAPAYSIYVVYIIYASLASGIIMFFSSKSFSISISLYMKHVVARCSSAFLLCLALSALPMLFTPPSSFRLIATSGVSLIFFSVTVWSIGLDANERRSVRAMLSVFGVRLHSILMKIF